MKSILPLVIILWLAASSCGAGHSPRTTGSLSSVPNARGSDGPHALDATGANPADATDEADAGADIPLTRSRIDADVRGAGLPVLFDKEADLSKDGIADRLIILEDPAKGSQHSDAGPASGRRLMLYRGLPEGGQYAVWAVTPKAIPPYSSRHMAGAETNLEDVRVGEGTFSFSWVNENHFTYRYQFVYDATLQTLKLSEMVVEEERAERFSQEEVSALRLTEKNFGQQPIEFFDAGKLQLFTDPDVRRRFKL